MLPSVARTTGVSHHAQLLVEMGFCVGWLQTEILPISAPQVARIRGMCHWHLFFVFVLYVFETGSCYVAWVGLELAL
jgi:hypothetical protein